MRVLVCGSRDWTDRDAIRARLQQLPAGSTIIEGEQRGADRLARDVARELGFAVEKFPADWKRYKRAAGPIRNREMLTTGHPTLVLAFHADLPRSKGTADMVRQASAAGLPVEVIGESQS